MASSPTLSPPVPLSAIRRPTSVDSEVGRLRSVLVHRPGRELDRLEPDTAEDMLFDDVPWPEGAIREHDAFTTALTACGVRPHFLDSLLAAALKDHTCRSWLLDETLISLGTPTHLRPPLREWLTALPATTLAENLIAGVTYHELPFGIPGGLTRCARQGAAYAIPPLPNQTFVRDSSSRMFSTLLINRLTDGARRREGLLLEAVYTAPFSGDHALPVTTGPDIQRTDVEGGDMLVAAPGCAVLAISGRSSVAAVEALSTRLLSGGVREVVATEIPAGRRTLHLDTIVAMVDADRFLVSGAAADGLVGHRLRLTPAGHLACAEDGPLFEVLADALGVPALDVIRAGGDPAAREREQWNEGANLLTVAPGQVIAYERATRTNDALAAAGIEVVAVPGAELSRGRGGPHCMSCPVEREALA